jgi:hypothetical protein
MTNTSNSRPDAAAFWLAQATHYLQCYLARPERGRLDNLVEILQQYQNAVTEGRVEPMRFLFPRGE